MLLCEAEEIIMRRIGGVITNPSALEDEMVVRNMDADILAVQCIMAQMRLADMLNDFWSELEENDSLTARLVYEILRSMAYDAEFDEDGMFDLEATEGGKNGQDSDSSESDDRRSDRETD